MRRLTTYESARLERMLENWVRSKQGCAVGSLAASSAFDPDAIGRSEEYQCRIPVLQAEAEMIDEIVDGRPASQLRAAIERMPEVWRAPLRLAYLEQRTQRQAAKLLNIAQQTVNDRLRAAKYHLVVRIFNKCDSAETRASA